LIIPRNLKIRRIRLFDLIINRGTIIDGTGKTAFEGDIAIQGEYIAEMGDLKDAPAKERVNASGCLVTPGFIDVHSHGDTSPLVNPQTESKIRQGITTQIAGNCGSSAFPLKGERYKEVKENLEKYGLSLDWDTAEGYFKRLEEARPAINTASFVGQGSIRASVIGEKDVPADADKMREMREEVAKAMDQGAIGMSTGLIYAPGYFASQEELIELMRVSAAKHGLYSSHIRGEGDTLIEAVTEALLIGQKANAGVQVSHLKASGPRNWGNVKTAIDLIEKSESEGLDISFDKYPYTAGSTDLASYLPRWAIGGGVERLMQLLQDPKSRSRIFRETDEQNEGEKKWSSVVIISAESDEYRPYEGQSIQEIAENRGLTVEEVFTDLLLKSKARTDIVCFTQSQEDTDLALLHRLGLVCTDSGVWAPYGPLSKIKPHPRAYGTFPRFLNQYVKEKKALTLEQAIRKATSKSAERFHLAKRGTIKKGYYADILVLDWENLKDTATYTNPHQYPDGVKGAIVNGTLTLWNGKITDKRAGRVLRLSGEKVE
jgi:N-acyl-D-amino-acid deacylase